MNSFNSQNWKAKLDRLSFLSLTIFLFAAIIVARLFWLQIVGHASYKEQAQNQHLAEKELIPNRGEIFIHDYQTSAETLYPVAVNKKFFLAYAVPNLVKNAKSYSRLLAPVLEMEETVLNNRLAKENDVYEPLKHKLTEEKKAEIEALGLDGIRFEEEVFRYYPEGEAMAQVLGFVGYEGDELKGRYGVEGFWDKELTGNKGSFVFERDALGRLIPVALRIKADQKNGADITLTLDRSIQFVACGALKESVERYGAQDGSVVIMDPKTGAIMAMCNWPSYDNNNYQNTDNYNLYNNAAVFEPYESGSMMKGLTIASALDAGKITPETAYEDTGSVEIAGYTIKNSDNKAHGFKTMTEVLEESLNTGAIFAARTIGPGLLYQYFKRFGFGEKIDLGLTGVRTGNLSALKQGSEISMATAAFGQGFTVTPLEIATAFSAIANNGKLMKPYIIEEVKYSNGKTVKTEPQFVRQVVSEKTAVTLSAMLGSVVKYGHAKKAAINGYFIAGKTGTAEIADPETGKYYSDRNVHSFIGFAPLENPRFVMLTKLTSPKGVRFAESTAVPLFQKIGQFLVNYLKITPSQPID